ncbi:GNAT family N-acetyltransferase [Deinococcus cellulosilyticus]|uniref:N-acetyltransferase domain-containing protein n=1 Tax=Deinococcus cellulosilyticus (strain DSM 18568 / NBRC 106333 / KACC 11606 / 5516J-15) TaxID=1223518 RepID=A0A511N1Z9_DEIC1|nr:GNAT family N-acetyltransferase [Deinococcus cellulosilyticus]GEM46885.1 hypothetical protein DC3_25200 [Deinococcus cellulosilyticus NBRC 106333 = KACC 11606]
MKQAAPADALHIAALMNQSRKGWDAFVPVKPEEVEYNLKSEEAEIFLHGQEALLEVYHHENADRVICVYPYRHPEAPETLEDDLLVFAKELCASRGLPLEMGLPHTREREAERLRQHGLSYTRTFYRMVLEGEALAKIQPPVLQTGQGFRRITPLELTEMHNDAFQNHFGFYPMGVQQVENWFGEHDFHPDDAQALCVNGKPVAFFAISKQDDGGHVYLLGTLQESQKQGYGGLTLRQGCALLKARGVEKVNLAVDAENSHALEFYRRVGFEERFQNLRYRWSG